MKTKNFFSFFLFAHFIIAPLGHISFIQNISGRLMALKEKTAFLIIPVIFHFLRHQPHPLIKFSYNQLHVLFVKTHLKILKSIFFYILAMVSELVCQICAHHMSNTVSLPPPSSRGTTSTWAKRTAVQKHLSWFWLN